MTLRNTDTVGHGVADPLVSVVTIFLNEERFLREAVESVRAQTYRNWELLLCDDGSVDGSSAIARAYARRDPDRIRYLEHPGHENRGMSATRNLGLRQCRGTLIALLDGDDVWMPRKLERQVQALEDHPRAAMVYGPSLYWHSWSGRAEDRLRDDRTRLATRPGRVVKGRRIVSRVLRYRGESPCTCSLLARLDAVLEVGGFEERFRGLFEDQVFLAKLLITHDVLVIGECLDRYRQHPGSCCAVSSRIDGEVIARRTEYLRWLRDYIAGREVGVRLRWDVARELGLQRFPTLVRFREWFHETRRSLKGRAVQTTFSLGRRVLPASVRQWLWTKLEGGRA